MAATVTSLPTTERTVACCVCKKVRVSRDEFVSSPDVLAFAGDEVSHTYCPACALTEFGMDRAAYEHCWDIGF